MTDTDDSSLEFANIGEFVQKFLSSAYARQVSDSNLAVWCPEWWHHPEAYLRMTAMWRAYERLRRDRVKDPTGLSAWWLDHADPHMAKLLDPQGPFKYCSRRNGHKPLLTTLPVGLTDNPVRHQLARDDMKQPAFATPEDFVNVWLSSAYARQVSDSNDTVWCPQWWLHEEAVQRLTALWRAYEHHRTSRSTGLSEWWLDHADRHMARLFDPQGPFKYCSVRHGHKEIVPALPMEVPPDAIFSDLTPQGWERYQERMGLRR